MASICASYGARRQHFVIKDSSGKTSFIVEAIGAVQSMIRNALSIHCNQIQSLEGHRKHAAEIIICLDILKNIKTLSKGMLTVLALRSSKVTSFGK